MVARWKIYVSRSSRPVGVSNVATFLEIVLIVVLVLDLSGSAALNRNCTCVLMDLWAAKGSTQSCPELPGCRTRLEIPPNMKVIIFITRRVPTC